MPYSFISMSQVYDLAISGSGSGSAASASYALSSSYSSYALTASYALNGGSGGGGGSSTTAGSAVTQSFTNEATWSFTHGLGTKYVSFEIYDTSDEVIIPDRILSNNPNTASIYFPVLQSGLAMATYGSGDATNYALTIALS